MEKEGPRPSWRTARVVGGQIGALALLVAGLTAFQLLPTLRLVLDAGRTAGLSYADAVGSAVDLTVLKRLILPVELFEPVGESAAIVAESASTSGYIGLLLAAIAPVSLLASTARNRRLVRFFTLLGLLTLCAAWDGPLYQLQHWVFPMFRLPGRLLALVGLPMISFGVLLDLVAWPTPACETGTCRGTLARSAARPCALEPVERRHSPRASSTPSQPVYLLLHDPWIDPAAAVPR